MPASVPTEAVARDRFLFYALLALVVWLPLPLGSNRPWASAIMQAGTFALLGAWLLGWGFGRWPMPAAVARARPALFVYGAFLAWVALSLLPLPPALLALLSPTAHAVRGAASGQALSHWAPLSLSPHDTAWALREAGAYGALFFLTLALTPNRSRLRVLAGTVVVAALFQAVYGSLMTLSGLEYGFFVKKYAGLGHATGTFINRNHLAGYLGLGLGVGVGLMLTALRPGGEQGASWRARLRDWAQLGLSRKLQLRLALVAMVIALVLTHSRMGNSAFLLAVLIAGPFGLLLGRRRTGRAAVVLLVSLIVVDLSIVGAWFGVDKVVERVRETRIASDARFDFGPDARRAAADYLPTGSGLGTFYAVLPAYRTTPGAFLDHAHNDYLETLLETGVPGALALGLFVMLGVGVAVWVQWRRRDPVARGIAFGVTMASVTALVHALVEFNFQIPAYAATYAVILAMAWVCHALPGPAPLMERPGYEP